MGFIRFILVGLAAGWIVGRATRGKGYGLFGNLIIGVIGSLVGGYLFGLLGAAAPGTLGSLVTAVVGAIAFLLLLQLLRPSGRSSKSKGNDE